MAVRIAIEADIPAILEIYAPYVENTAYSFEYEAPTLEVLCLRFREITARFPWLVWEEDGRVLGYAYASAPFSRAAYQWCGEVSIYLHPCAHRKGIGRKLYTALERLLTVQGYQTVYAIITASNGGSLAFHAALGYRELARMPDCGFKMGRWQDVIWMEKRLKPVEIPSRTPVPWRQLVQSNSILTEILAKLTLS